ncbi:MAG: hypothetical protein Ta2A_11910 [Treponemataceae bacterium]|nr:MAG: hypothetical protein Ta2A_11910 [Treponemataceae bacterium]
MGDVFSITPTTYVVQKGDTMKKIAKRYYGDESKWPLIADANGGRNSRNWDLIYPGLSMYCPPDPAAKPQTPSVPKTPDDPPKAPNKSNDGKKPDGRNKAVRHQAPSPILKIIDRDGNVLEFSSTGKHKGLQAFNFSFAVTSLSTQWSATIDEDKKESGVLFDSIKRFSIVKIYCADSARPEFVGVLHTKTITSGSPIGHRSIRIGGLQVTSLLQDFTLSGDYAAFGDIQDANVLAKAFSVDLACEGDLTVEQYVKKTLAAYQNACTSSQLKGNSETFELWAKECGNGNVNNAIEYTGFDTGAQNPQEPKIFYPIAQSIFSNGVTNVVNIWRNLLSDKLYEIYGRVDAEGKPRVVVRKKPFSPEYWKNLNNVNIYPDVMSENVFDLTNSDTEVYTVFHSYLTGSPMSREQATIIDELNKSPSVIVMDGRDGTENKMKRYGYKIMEVNFMGYDTSKNVKSGNNYSNSLKDLNQLMCDWYGHNDELYSGTFKIVYLYGCTKDYQHNLNPEVGSVIDILGGQFYVESVTHNWSFGATHWLTLQVSRGGHYDNGGNYTGEFEKIGKIYNEFPS